jgi:hypothetical protein
MRNTSMKIIGCWLVVLFMLAVTATTQATLYTLTDDNSTALIDDSSSAGMSNWTIDGTNHMFQQWFWYRVGDTAEASIDTLVLIVGGATDTDFDGDDDTLYLRYGNDQAATQYTVEVRFILDGASAGSGLSDIAEQLSITNTGTSPLDFHFFQYSDFDLGGDGASNDTVQLANANTVQQSDPDWTVSETVVTPAADAFELDFFAITSAKLNDGVATTLGNAFGAGPVGPGNVTWAFQWDQIIPVGSAFQISKDKNMTPEPATLFVMLAAGLPMLLRNRRRRG